MYCFNCGKEVQGAPAYCTYCGAKLEGSDENTLAGSFQDGGNSLAQTDAVHSGVSENSAYADQPVLGMKWFKFIIYFQLFASMLMLIRDGSMAATGAHYGGDAEFIYTLWPSLKIIDSLYAIICFLLVIFAFYVRMSLAKYREQGPKLYLVLLLCNLFFPFLYFAAVSLATGVSVSEFLSANTVANALTSIILIFVNKKYFNKRRHLFTVK